MDQGVSDSWRPHDQLIEGAAVFQPMLGLFIVYQAQRHALLWWLYLVLQLRTIH